MEMRGDRKVGKFGFFNGKRAFAFTFLTFFIAAVLFAFVYLEMDRGDYTADNVFKESRISYVNDEIFYFKNTYIKNVASYCLYNSVSSLENYSVNSTNYAKIYQNYPKFNELVGEGMLYGSFEGELQDDLIDVDGQNKTIDYFVSLFQEDFENNFKGNFSFEVLDINVYEARPYYISAQILASYSVVTEDNISQWNFVDSFEVSVPIYDLRDPEFLYLGGFDVPIKASEYVLPDQNWNLENFNSTIVNTYTSIYVEPRHKYTLGSSFFERFLGISRSSYQNVSGFWSFDYDRDELGVFDSSLYSDLGEHFGNSKLVMSFDNGTVTGGVLVNDLTAYNSDGVVKGDTNCYVAGVFDLACLFDGSGDYIEISADDLNLENSSNVSISAWVYPLDLSLDPKIFSYGTGVGDEISLGVSGDKLVMGIGNHNGGSFYEFSSNGNVSLNKWVHVVGTFDGGTGVGKLYVDGFLDNMKDWEFEKGFNLTSFVKSQGVVSIGSDGGSGAFFNGRIDEIGVYSKVLSDEEVAGLFESKRAEFIDYVTSFHGEGIEFDGKDDFVNLGNSSELDFNVEQITVEAWIKPYDVENRNLIVDKGVLGSEGWGVDIRGGNVYFGFHGGATAWTNDLPIDEANKWYHIVVVGGDRSQGETLFYVNGVKRSAVNNGVWVNVLSSSSDVMIGKSSDSDDSFFKGVIDEVKIYARSLSADEIVENYYSYKSFGKGCCNYLTLVNPSKFGYNVSPTYDNNVSYSSKYFYDFYERSKDYNALLWNIETITSNETSQDYYNFLVDSCVSDAYGVQDFQNEDITLKIVNLDDNVDHGECSNLVSLGVY